MLEHARREPARRTFELLLVSALLAGACASSQAGVGPTQRNEAGSNELGAGCPPELVTAAAARSLVDAYCVSCHSPTGEAGEDYDFRSDAAIGARRANIEAKLRLRVMPPPNALQPSDAERTTLRCWAKQ